MSYFNVEYKPTQKALIKRGVLCDGDCGHVCLEEDMTRSAFGDIYCDECFCTFMNEQHDRQSEEKQ
jgi:hypothetical protein